LPVIQIKDALNKAYIKVSIERAEINKFKNEYINLLEGVRENPNEREEHFKNRLMSFLNKTWYDPNYYINTHSDFDMVVHNGEKSLSPIGVIIEAKRPGKSTEMVSCNNLNVKSMQQLLLYFFRETIDSKNINLKHLIITNTIEWFIFDASEFYHHFSKDKDLVNNYRDFRTGSLFEKDTQYFYNSIASPYIEKHKNNISFTYINIEDFENVIRSNDKTEDNKLIHIFKIFSPHHLLKKPFENDNNTLNQNFYFELLYILGLSEEKQDSKKIIVRCPKNTRQSASLLESAIFHLSDDIAHEDVLFSVSFELVITWINRILFLKLLEAQLLKYQDGNKAYAFLNTNKIDSYAELNTLFFKVLAVKPSNREETIKAKYLNVPYLNSSLFDKTDKEQRYPISNLQSKEMDLFSNTILKDENGNKRKGKISSLEYIFSFLDAYDFSSESVDTIKEYKKTLINASVLGLIFEKINGYRDGSYFTPGFITSYICSETIRRIVINKFNISKGWNAKTITDIYNEIDKVDIDEANEIINSITILDPAVGSGHFLVSALNEILAIKSELGILADNNGKRIKDYEVSVFNDELDIYETDAKEYKPFEYNANNNEKQRLQETIFNEKRKIIENSLFGVDLNNNSVQICRLRLWIELLKNAYYTKESNYKELETLPNLNLNIKCGNSLISRFELDTDVSETINSLDFTVQDYKDAVAIYKNSINKKTKDDLEEKIEKIKNSFRVKIKDLGKLFLRRSSVRGELVGLQKQEEFFEYENVRINKDKRIAQLEKEYANIEHKMNEEENSKIYEDAFEYRFEFPEILNDEGNFIGFDAVIGNPPYGILNKKQNKSESIVVPDEELEYYKDHGLYAPAQGGMLNIFRLFIVKSLSLLNHDGIFSQIFPLAFTGDISIKNLRKYILENTQIQFIEAFPERDDHNRRVFEAVKMSVCILQCQKKNPMQTETFHLRLNNDRYISDDENKTMLTGENIAFLQPQYLSIPLTTPIETKILNKTYKMGKRFIEYGSCGEGEVHMTACKSAFSIDNTKAVLLKGAIIDRYILRNKMSQGEIVYIDEDILHGIKTIDMDTINNDRIVMQGITGVNEKIRIKAMLVKGVYCANSLNYISIKKKMNNKYLLGLLNSKLINFIFKKFNTNSNVNGYEINNLPIIEADKENEKKITKLVDKVLTEKDKNPLFNTSSLEKEIDDLIYNLYHLDNSEIKIIERSS
jgi:Alw26I/Eco31I/Esp3I family type II restriction m6 adenine DNA methyltransferase